MMGKLKMNRRKAALILIDVVMTIVVYEIAVLLFSLIAEAYGYPRQSEWLKFVIFVLELTLVRCGMGVYRSIWRYVSTESYCKLVLSDFVGGILFVLFGKIFHLYYTSLAMDALCVCLADIAALSSRFIYQLLRGRAVRIEEYMLKRKHPEWLLNIAKRLLYNGSRAQSNSSIARKIDIAIVGAGKAGVALAQSFEVDPNSHYHPCCFFEIDTDKIGRTINGLTVYSAGNQLEDTIRKLPIQEVIIAVPNLSAERLQKMFDVYSRAGCKVKVYDVNEQVENTDKKAVQIRDFGIEDLLFRDSVKLDNPKVKAFYEGKNILVTGGGGSIGSELCRRIATYKPQKLTILDIYENNAYDIQQELIRKYGDKLNLEVVIASVRDEKRLDDVFRSVRPDIVFHAAAHKHVPLLEHSGVEAFKNNVLGTYNVANMCERYHVKKMLLVSTDKAVNPTNVMGASKRLCEMVVQSRRDSETEFCAVRFGNVLGSNGSVIPLFKRQIAEGGPVTLTDKRIIRYFMTIPEAAQLLTETCAMAKNGELFVLDMGKPVKILELAENMIRLSGFTPYKDIDIQEIGLRPGEKLYEELLMKTEELDKTENDKIFVERNRPIGRMEMERKLEIIRKAISVGTQEATLQAVIDTVPTYHSPEEVNEKAAEAEEMKAAV